MWSYTLPLVLMAALSPAQTPEPMRPDPAGKRPIAARDTIWLEEMTWMEVRDAMKAGKTTVIIPTGGVEQNGPYLAAGKHNIILRATGEAIARKLGNALVAPVVEFVPEGNINPPSSHMLYPSTISVREDTFERLLTDIADSLKAHGFEHVFLIGDSGGNVRGMAAVATRLSKLWAGKATIHHIPEYYDYPGVKKWLETQGIREGNDGIHDDFAITAQMMVVDPTTVRMKERIAAVKFVINGVQLSPPEKTIAMGRKIVAYRTDVTVAAMKKALAR